MCGIAGFFLNQIDRPDDVMMGILKSMTDSIAYRGPDGADYHYDRDTGLGFGHRRLSIIDLSDAGKQPMQSANGRFIITYNGELYNTEELRSPLIKGGKTFRGHSDTEVLVEYIDSFGIDKTLSDVNGMFAFAVFDRQDRTLYLARDHVGVKPLFWAHQSGQFLFASEMKPFLTSDLFKAQFNEDCLSDYFTFNTVPAPQTILQDCYQLQQGHYLVIREGQAPKVKHYWSVPTEETDKDVDFEALLKDSVKRQMVSDVPLGVFLSGGIDSSLVTALAQNVSGGKTKTFTIGFQEDAFDESKYAAKVAKHLGTEHYEDILTVQQAQKIVTDLPFHYDQPFADSSQLPCLLLSEMARKHVTVCLSGDGGDELFNGYTRYTYGDKIFAYANMIGKVPFASEGLSILSKIGLEAIIKRPKNISLKMDKLAQMSQCKTLNDQYELLIDVWPHSPVKTAPNRSEQYHSMRHHDMGYYLPNDILHKMDRASMAHSLEVRVPLLDHRVVEAAFRTPLSKHGYKDILKNTLARYVPRELFERPKSGFCVPIDQWLRHDLRDLCETMLDQKKLMSCPSLDADMIRQKWDQHQAGTHDHKNALWGVLMLMLWRDHYKI